MTNKLEKIAAILGITLSSNEVVEQTFAAEGKLASGVRIFTEAESFEVGAIVQVESEAGMVIPEAGEHVMEDGSVIVTDEAGVITEIRVPEIEEEPIEEPVNEELAEEEIVDEEEKFAFSKKD